MVINTIFLVHLSNFEVVSTLTAMETVIGLVKVSGSGELGTWNMGKRVQIQIVDDPVNHRGHGGDNENKDDCPRQAAGFVNLRHCREHVPPLVLVWDCCVFCASTEVFEIWRKAKPREVGIGMDGDTNKLQRYGRPCAHWLRYGLVILHVESHGLVVFISPFSSISESRLWGGKLD